MNQNARKTGRLPGLHLPMLYHGTTRRQWLTNPGGETHLYLSSSLADAKNYAYEAAAHEESEGKHDFEAVIVEFSPDAVSTLLAQGLRLRPDSGWIDGLAHNAKATRRRLAEPTWQESLLGCHGVAIVGFEERYKMHLPMINADDAVEANVITSRLFIAAAAEADFADSPRWIVVHNPIGLLGEVFRLQSVVRNNGLVQAQVALRPDAWGPTETRQTFQSYDEVLIVTATTFRFSWAVDFADYRCQSTSLEIAALGNAVTSHAAGNMYLGGDPEQIARDFEVFTTPRPGEAENVRPQV